MDKDQKKKGAELRRQALRAILRRKGMTAKEFAEGAGLPSANSLYNFLNGRSDSLSARTIEILVQAYDDVTHEDFVKPRAPEEDKPAFEARLVTTQVYLRGAVNGYATESWEFLPDRQKRLTFPFAGKAPAGLYALQVMCSDTPYPSGSILLCAPFGRYGKPVESGRRVIVHRYSGDLVEAVVAQFKEANGRTLLRINGSKDVSVPEGYKGGLIEVEDGDLEISAIVVASYCQEESPGLEQQRQSTNTS